MILMILMIPVILVTLMILMIPVILMIMVIPAILVILMIPVILAILTILKILVILAILVILVIRFGTTCLHVTKLATTEASKLRVVASGPWLRTESPVLANRRSAPRLLSWCIGLSANRSHLIAHSLSQSEHLLECGSPGRLW